MQALILAAGEGLRLRPITKNIPKVMVPVFGKPILDHHIIQLRKYGITDIYINLYYKAEKIIEYFADGKDLGVKIIYSREDLKNSFSGPMLLGSAGSLHNFKKYLHGDFFILYGDVFMEVDFLKMLSFHKKNKSLFTLAVHASDHPRDSDLVEIDSLKKIINWIKKPHNKNEGLNNAGLYIMQSSLLSFLPQKVPCDFAHDFIPLLLAKKIPVYGYETQELLMDIGTKERYSKFLKKLND